MNKQLIKDLAIAGITVVIAQLACMEIKNIESKKIKNGIIKGISKMECR